MSHKRRRVKAIKRLIEDPGDTHAQMLMDHQSAVIKLLKAEKEELFPFRGP